MKNFYMALVVFLAGCASSSMPPMTHPDKNANYQKDYDECMQEAQMLASPSDPEYENMMRPSTLNDNTIECMKARGWKQSY